MPQPTKQHALPVVPSSARPRRIRRKNDGNGFFEATRRGAVRELLSEARRLPVGDPRRVDIARRPPRRSIAVR